MRLFGKEKEKAIEREIERNGVADRTGRLNSTSINLDR